MKKETFKFDYNIYDNNDKLLKAGVPVSVAHIKGENVIAETDDGRRYEISLTVFGSLSKTVAKKSAVKKK